MGVAGEKQRSMSCFV